MVCRGTKGFRDKKPSLLHPCSVLSRAAFHPVIHLEERPGPFCSSPAVQSGLWAHIHTCRHTHTRWLINTGSGRETNVHRLPVHWLRFLPAPDHYAFTLPAATAGMRQGEGQGQKYAATLFFSRTRGLNAHFLVLRITAGLSANSNPISSGL